MIGLSNELANQGRSDEAGAAGHEIRGHCLGLGTARWGGELGSAAWSGGVRIGVGQPVLPVEYDGDAAAEVAPQVGSTLAVQ